MIFNLTKDKEPTGKSIKFAYFPMIFRDYIDGKMKLIWLCNYNRLVYYKSYLFYFGMDKQDIKFVEKSVANVK